MGEVSDGGGIIHYSNEERGIDGGVDVDVIGRGIRGRRGRIWSKGERYEI